jgi:succinate dehydrogenase / fumarate reductase flavoprotein subunit/fumarate reductase flavoprotein subunit
MADAPVPPSVMIAVKGLYGKSGCTRLVQGGYNAVLQEADSLEKHFLDTLRGGQWINNQELAWRLVNEAPARVLELESRVGCFFDRNPDGSIHQKPFAGQSFDRTIHKGDLTGIEIINRLSEQVTARANTTILEEVRAIDLLLDVEEARVVGAVLLNIREGRFIVAHAKATLLATGGGPTMYKLAAPCYDKSCDGIAMAYRAGAPLMDMEMVQFHPTGLLVGNRMISGTVLEEGLRGVGAHLKNHLGERYMHKYDSRAERATRDVVSRSNFIEIMEGRGTPEGAVLLDASHLGADFIMERFPGMTLRCQDVGYDLTREPVPVSPTAHFQMGGVKIDLQCHTPLEGLFAAGEDSAGAHGANRLGGNGVAESTVFGGIAGDIIAHWVRSVEHKPFSKAQVEQIITKTRRPFENERGVSVYPLRDRLKAMMWHKAGLIRTKNQLKEAQVELAEIRDELGKASCPNSSAYNLVWMDILNMENYLEVSQAIVNSALAREESRGSHFRSDFPEKDDENYLCNFVITKDNPKPVASPVNFSRLQPDGS